MTVAYKDSDRATDHLLDFIAGGVPTNKYGESAGNYNAVFGDIDASDPLDQKTFSQIYSMQTAMVNENGISSATGRYQALKTTLQEYQKRKSLKDSDLLAQVVQDDFGLCKMIDRGYSAWWKKQISDDEFMHRLSCEWASLPDPKNGGKSHYDGDSAGNHASTSLGHFRACLREARAFIDAGTEPTPEEPSPPDDVRRVLREGMVGPDVTEAQTILNDKGFAPEGMFGSETTHAVRAFQTARDLDPVDGIIGPDTWAALLEQT